MTSQHHDWTDAQAGRITMYRPCYPSTVLGQNMIGCLAASVGLRLCLASVSFPDNVLDSSQSSDAVKLHFLRSAHG
ncbi:predicted protein [Plenodomus lingam JN3]|uniref:Uncharacterized protein n=1 Tax=Leptosphaeria maculans (strain JN3 / isolate v23.1.3 / race Av1-4-5-6-7-8) TaxID=985895 RepID=E4ZG81_LEPMJ|nr:predicted protein [Plenodomus lingam JN3]CBX90301.1 predicted protein [Plenodomus lingam JN3]